MFVFLLLGIEPEVELFRLQDDRHSVVQAGHGFGSIGGQDSAGLDDLFSFLVFPVFPQAGEGHWLLVCSVNEEGLLGAFFFVPLEETVCGDQAAPAAEGGSKGRTFMGGFGAGVEGSVADFAVVGPEGDEAPVEGYQPAPVFLQAHGGHIQGRGDIVPWLRVEGFVQEEIIPEVFGRKCL